MVIKQAPTFQPQADFEAVAQSYRAAAVKPVPGEELHKFHVQADTAVGNKDFMAAADYYGQALEVAPWWPEGHFNRALVLAGADDTPDAIIEMSRYLALVPDASNARAAQDQIYEWQAMVK